MVFVFFILYHLSLAQDNIPYGNNPKAGRYFQTKDAKIYYETYGTGRPLLLLHGGLFGYISEYKNIIPLLSKHFQVIAIASRGHGKSEIGKQPFSYSLMADDAYALLRSITKDSAVIIGFSYGAGSGMALSVNYPDAVRKLVFVGGLLGSDHYRPETLKGLEEMSGESLEKAIPDIVADIRKLMPQPERWNEFVEKLKNAWLQPRYVDRSKVGKLSFPVLVVGGDRDSYISAETFIQIYELLPNAQLSIIPNCDHVVFECKPELMQTIIMSFVL